MGKFSRQVEFVVKCDIFFEYLSDKICKVYVSAVKLCGEVGIELEFLPELLNTYSLRNTFEFINSEDSADDFVLDLLRKNYSVFSLMTFKQLQNDEDIDQAISQWHLKIRKLTGQFMSQIGCLQSKMQLYQNEEKKFLSRKSRNFESKSLPKNILSRSKVEQNKNFQIKKSILKSSNIASGSSKEIKSE